MIAALTLFASFGKLQSGVSTDYVQLGQLESDVSNYVAARGEDHGDVLVGIVRVEFSDGTTWAIDINADHSFGGEIAVALYDQFRCTDEDGNQTDGWWTCCGRYCPAKPCWPTTQDCAVKKASRTIHLRLPYQRSLDHAQRRETSLPNVTSDMAIYQRQPPIF